MAIVRLEQGDPVTITVPLLEWLISWARTGMRSDGANPADYGRLELMKQIEQAAALTSAFEREDAGPLKPGWVNLDTAATTSGEPLRTWQDRCKAGRVHGRPIRPAKLSGWYIHNDDIRKALEQ